MFGQAQGDTPVMFEVIELCAEGQELAPAFRLAKSPAEFPGWVS